MELSSFSQLPISSEVLSALSDMGFSTPSPIQALAIPSVIEGIDVVGQAQTGTGKTVAFGIPMVEKVSSSIQGTQALVLCPTRELAIQIAEEVNRLLTYKKGINVVPIYGGQPIERQFASLKRGAHIVIGTPGRVMDHLDRKTLQLKNVSMVVLDEADEMLDRGFREDIEAILQFIPAERQTIFFSATMSKPIMELTKRYQVNPRIIQIERTAETAPKIEQSYVMVKEQTKFDALCRFLDLYNHRLAVIFCKTRRRVSELVEKLHMANYRADALHGDMKQSSRDAVMGKFRKGSINILVATDVAARGIDVENVEAVFNYDFPSNSEYYLHRIGRTGRAGKAGASITFAVGRELYSLQHLQRSLHCQINQVEIPSDVVIEKIRIEAISEKLAAMKGNEKQIASATAAFEVLCGYGFSAAEAGALLLAHVMGIPKTTIDPNAPRERESSRKQLPANSEEFAVVQLSVGKSDRVRTSDIVGAVAGETGIGSENLGIILLSDRATFVEIPHPFVEKTLSAMNAAFIRGKKVVARKATDEMIEKASQQRAPRGPQMNHSSPRNRRFSSTRQAR
jgi:ATP-dependent RNA helicase DeaD